MSFSEKLKKLRKSRNMTQLEMSELLGCSINAYQRYETGVTYPNPSMLIKICKYFQINLDSLIDEKNFLD